MSSGELWTLGGFATGALILFFVARSRGLATPGMRLVALSGILGGVLGARITEWFFGVAQFANHNPGAFLDPRNGGKSLVGGLIFGWMSVEIAKKRLGIKRSTGDLWALALPAGEAVGRIGCFLNGCCFGLPFSGFCVAYQHGAWRHPTQIYSSLSAALLFAVLWKLRAKLPREGDLFRLYLLLYGISRFSIEFVRQRDFIFGALSLVQVLCLGAAIYAAFSLFSPRQTPQPNPAL
ncbi:MAG TPA: prolipoprotein diacylglyceryl transferase family protein [Abditibacterium sp.]